MYQFYRYYDEANCRIAVGRHASSVYNNDIRVEIIRFHCIQHCDHSMSKLRYFADHNQICAGRTIKYTRTTQHTNRKSVNCRKYVYVWGGTITRRNITTGNLPKKDRCFLLLFFIAHHWHINCL